MSFFLRTLAPRPARIVLIAAITLAAIMGETCEGAAHDVLLYYANETAPTAEEATNYDTIIGWLRGSKNPIHERTSDQLDVDRRVFAAAVDVETAEIIAEIPRSPS